MGRIPHSSTYKELVALQEPDEPGYVRRKRRPTRHLTIDEKNDRAAMWGREPHFTRDDIRRYEWITALLNRIRQVPGSQRAAARRARRAANAADPLRPRQLRKKYRPQCGSLAGGPNKPCRAHVMPYRDETGAPKLRPLCFKHWNEAQALEAKRRAEREAKIARGECICDAARNCGYHLPSCPKWWSQ